MFGNNNSFGNTSFGSSTFGSGFGATPQLGPFGSTTQTTLQSTGPVGTTIRFVPLNGTDNVQKAGSATGPAQVTTRHQNISAMKEYESKSNDELRLEDYAANRKVGQPQNAFGASQFGSMQPSTSQQGSSIFGMSSQSTPNLFGNTTTTNQTSNIFGQPKTGFELNSSTGIFSSSLNKPQTTVASSPFNIGGSTFTNNTSTSGAQTGFPLFNNTSQTTSTPFGASSVNSPFKTSMFSSPTTNTGSLFNTNNNSGTSSFLNTSQTNTAAQTPAFGSGNPIFGTSNTGTGAFGSTNLFNTQQKTGFELNNTSTSGIFSSLNKPATTTANASPFQIGTGAQSTPNLFGSNTTTNQSSNIFGQPKTGFELNSSTGIFSSSLNKPQTTVASSPFNIGTSAFNTTANTSTTGAQTAGQTGFPLFNNTSQTTTTPFGTAAVNSPFKTSMFSSPTTNTGSLFNTTNNSGTSNFLNTSQTNTAAQAPAFGTGNSIFGTSNTGTGAFGSTNLFNTQQKTGFELNNTSTSGIFSSLNKPATTPATSPFQVDNQQQQQSPQSSDLFLNRLKSLPYGETSLFLNDSSNNQALGSLKFTTDPKTISQYKMDAKTNVKLGKPSSPEKSMANSILFDGLDDATSDDLRCAIDVFVPKKSIKKLDLKPSSHMTDGDAEHASSSPAFERSRTTLPIRSNLNANNETERVPFARHVRYADNTYPGTDPDASYAPTTANISSGSDLSSLHNSGHSGLNRSSASVSSMGNGSSFNRSSLTSKCGIINTRPDYRIRPTIEEIERCYNPENDTCYVNSFLIERPNYGSILFESRLDVKDLNLDEIVHIRRKEVVVYPDDENKPPIGQGLNRPAIITLHQVWPLDKSNCEVIKDINRLNLMRYPEKIEAATIEKGARFIEYRPETGSWAFAVKHFSKYGITDDDEQLDEPIPPVVNNQATPLARLSQSALNVPQNGGLLLDRLKTSPLSDSLSFINSRPTKLQVTDQVSDVMRIPQEMSQSSAFKMTPKTSVKLNKTSEFDDSRTNSIPLDSFADASNYSMRNAIDELFYDEGDLETVKSDAQRSFSVHGSKRLALQNTSPNMSLVAYDKPITVGAEVPKHQKIREIKIKPDLYPAYNKLSRDIMSMKAAGSSKIRFFKGSRMFCYIRGDTVIVNELKLVPTPNDHLDEDLTLKFENFFENNSVVTSLCMNPILVPYIETNDFIADASSHDLLYALYGNLNSKTPYAKQNERLNRVIDWLACVNRQLPQPTNLYQQIIYHMSCDRYDLASNLAIENYHPRLALLVATLNLNKDLIFEQLSSWRLSTADQYVDPELMKIYILLSGLTEWKLSNDVTIYCLKGLKWTQQLCLLALHVPTFVTEPEKYGFHMLPLYIKRLDTNTDDVDYHILARHSPSSILSAAVSIVEEWFLLESLKSFHVINSESECNSDVIHCNLASQLAPLDLRWACFVALHISNNAIRNHVVLTCLEQNYDQLRLEKQDKLKPGKCVTVERWLIEKLKIPVEFIESSKKLAPKSGGSY